MCGKILSRTYREGRGYDTVIAAGVRLPLGSFHRVVRGPALLLGASVASVGTPRIWFSEKKTEPAYCAALPR